MSVKQLVMTGLGLLLLAQLFASLVVHPMRPEAKENTPDGFFTELPPGEIAGTLMLGGFRGMAIDFLWLRAIKAKEEARYYESVALFDLISRVQPRFEKVWEYMAWDMAYNIGHYVDQKDDKWSWYLAGLRANLRGVEVNPDSERLLRHLAWMYFHKGDNYMERIEQTDWQPIIADTIAPYQDDMPMPTDKNISSFALAEYFYRLAVMVAERGQRKQPVFIRRMVPLAVDRDGNRLRNRGRHYEALQRYVDALAAWQEIKEWVENPTGYYRPNMDTIFSDESYQRNEGLLRRKMASLARQLAKDSKLAESFINAVHSRDIETCRTLIQQTDQWRDHIQRTEIRWLDEMSESPQPQSDETTEDKQL